MTFDPKTLTALDVHLHGRRVGVITRLQGDKQIFTLHQSYIDDPHRPTLSLSLKGKHSELVTAVRPVHRGVPPLFSNLLPEGHLRTYLAERAGVSAEREFILLAALGEDMAGAITVTPQAASQSLGIDEVKKAIGIDCRGPLAGLGGEILDRFQLIW